LKAKRARGNLARVVDRDHLAKMIPDRDPRLRHRAGIQNRATWICCRPRYISCLSRWLQRVGR
jgi:hypothetical protein